MKVLYSYNKNEEDAIHWDREIQAASTPDCQLVPFNHGRYLNGVSYHTAKRLDDLYWNNNSKLCALYGKIGEIVSAMNVDALVVTNCPPYHPEFLRTLSVYKVLYNTDDPIATYERNIPYLHAYDHVFYYNPYYRPERDMATLIRECGVKRADWVPLGVFDVVRDASKTSDSILDHDRPIDIIYIGAAQILKLPTLAAIKKAMGPRMKLFGWFSFKKNVYFNVKYGCFGWIRAIPRADYVKLYQRSKIGINIGERGIYGIANYRLYDLAANGVLQICEGGAELSKFYEVGREIIGYDDVDDLIAKTQYYVTHERERNEIARAGFKRAMRDYTFRGVTQRAMRQIKEGIRHTRVLADT